VWISASYQKKKVPVLNLCLNGIMTHLVETVLASGTEAVEGTRIALIHKMSVKRPVEKQVRLLLKIACQSEISVKID